ncbi:ATP-binding protein [Paraclostridium bifermentans]
MAIFIVTVILVDYYRKKSFFQNFNDTLDSLDEKYLITEMVDSPSFIEGKIFYESLYEIDKSMHEEIDVYKKSVNDFKEYIEMWIHEVKLPIASTTLILHNNKEDAPKKIKDQINRIENYVEEVLYFVRSDNAEKDYIIKHCNLEDIINPVIRRNKDSLLLKKIFLEIEDLNHVVLTDSKWMGFIINQIISNSIKYSKENPKIKIEAKAIDDEVVLEIEDNGIGINEKDINKVFNKSFTGENGRKISSSTGMGLYLVKKLCDKLGHKVKVESQVGEFTKISICFSNNEYYSCVR